MGNQHEAFILCIRMLDKPPQPRTNGEMPPKNALCPSTNCLSTEFASAQNQYACDFLPEAYRERNGKLSHDPLLFWIVVDDSAGGTPWNSMREKMLPGYSAEDQRSQPDLHSLTSHCMERRYTPPAVHLPNALLSGQQTAETISETAKDQHSPEVHRITSIQCALYHTFYHNTGEQSEHVWQFGTHRLHENLGLSPWCMHLHLMAAASDMASSELSRVPFVP